MADQIETSKFDAYVMVGASTNQLIVSKFDAYVMIGPPPRRRVVNRMYTLTTATVPQPLIEGE